MFRSVHSAHYQMAQPFRNRSMLTMYNTGKTVVPKRRIMRKTFASQALMGTYVCHERTATTKEEKIKKHTTSARRDGRFDLLRILDSRIACVFSAWREIAQNVPSYCSCFFFLVRHVCARARLLRVRTVYSDRTLGSFSLLASREVLLSGGFRR